jgi:hypothetical protein
MLAQRRDQHRRQRDGAFAGFRAWQQLQRRAADLDDDLLCASVDLLLDLCSPWQAFGKIFFAD